jgi:hypothetical protein
MKAFFKIILCFSLMLMVPLKAQDVSHNKKERKKVRKGWKKSNMSYNPYLDKKAKDKPSARMARSEKKELKKQKRKARKQMRRSKKRIKH